jgi:nicotinamide-nucleotide amidase
MDFAQKIINELKVKSLTLSTAESCTGGMIGAALTDIAGSSSVYLGGIIAYANQIKNEQLGVPLTILEKFGAVSRETAMLMAEGAKAKLRTDYAIAVTGIAGPTGGSSLKPVGLVYIAIATPLETLCYEMRYGALPRDKIREKTCYDALKLVLEAL